jgi:hypothetical protein
MEQLPEDMKPPFDLGALQELTGLSNSIPKINSTSPTNLDPTHTNLQSDDDTLESHSRSFGEDPLSQCIAPTWGATLAPVDLQVSKNSYADSTTAISQQYFAGARSSDPVPAASSASYRDYVVSPLSTLHSSVPTTSSSSEVISDETLSTFQIDSPPHAEGSDNKHHRRRRSSLSREEARHRNTVAGRKYRNKRRQEKADLEAQASQARQDNLQLVHECEKLRGQLYDIKNEAFKHVSCECSISMMIEEQLKQL